ncbi:hypothetical protein [Bradyrhizobium sp.]|uniref:hypothetical protein n=1 Tax=Bradyrhizobium sp. TaxID=376 RepID=UPI003C1898C6
MSRPARDLLWFLCASALTLLAAAALNFMVDPLQLFGPARLFAAMYSPDSRMQDAGLIRSQDFDTVFMGTSLAIHFRQSDIDSLLGVRSLKLSMTGSNSHEQSFVLAAALDRHPGRVIWEVDDWIFRDAPEVDHDIYLPADLYRRNTRGIAGYLFSAAMTRESAWILLRSIPPLRPAVARLTNGVMFRFPIARVDDINILRPDVALSEAYNAGKARAAFADITDPAHRRYLSDGYDYEAMVRNFEHDAIGLIAAHPDVKFDIYFPPYSILQWVAMRDASPATLRIVYDFSAYIGQRLTQFQNVGLHDFRAVADVSHDLDNYADVIHHSPAVDLKVLAWLAQGKYLVDRAAPLRPLAQLKAQVAAYRLEGMER